MYVGSYELINGFYSYEVFAKGYIQVDCNNTSRQSYRSRVND